MLDENRRGGLERDQKKISYSKKKKVIVLPYHVVCTNQSMRFMIKFLMAFISENCIHIHTSEHLKIRASGARLGADKLGACPSVVTGW